MFEDQTFEAIMERMLNSISADIDTREGSVIYNALAPAAAELAKSYIWLDTVLELVFSDTAQGEFLDRRAAEAGIERTAATKAVRAGEFTSGVTIPVGSRFYVDNLYFQYTADGTQFTVIGYHSRFRNGHCQRNPDSGARGRGR